MMMTDLVVIGRRTESGTPDGQQLQPFHMYGAELTRVLGIRAKVVGAMDLDTLKRLLQSEVADIIMVMTAWSEPMEPLIECFRGFYEQLTRPRLIFLDYYAPSCSPHFPLLPYVDVYAKRQVLRDRSLYQHDYVGGYIVTSFLSCEMQYDIGDWHFGSKPDPAYVERIVPAWNLGVTPRYRQLLKWSSSRIGRCAFPWRRRSIDINQRFGPKPDDKSWYARYRRDALHQLDRCPSLLARTGTERVSSTQYYFEMLRSKLVVSPFGWGELCFRDYEAVACGGLLVKPSMAHLETSPNIFVENETYIPVRWDLSDLADKCQYYLEHEDEAERIAAAAQRQLRLYYEDGGFCADISRILSIKSDSRASLSSRSVGVA
jgi:hypothetical protein